MYCFMVYDLEIIFINFVAWRFVSVVFFTKILIRFFNKHHSKSTSGSCEFQFTLYALCLISYSHHGAKTSS